MADLSCFLSSSSLDENSSFSFFTNNGSCFVSHFTNVQDRKLFLLLFRSVYQLDDQWVDVASRELVLPPRDPRRELVLPSDF